MANQAPAYGFVGLKHLFSERLTTVNTQTLMTAVTESAQEHSHQTDSLLADFVQKTDLHQMRFQLPGSGTMQPLDEYGIPKTVREAGFYDVAFPIQGAGTGYGFDRIAAQLKTVDDLNRAQLNAQMRDADWMRRHVMAALLTNATWTYDDKLYGNLTIQPLANGDSVKYPLIDATNATDDHFLAQLAAIDDTHNPFPGIRNELIHHLTNRGPFVAYIPANLRDSVEGLTEFVEIQYPAIRVGVNTDVIVEAIDPGFGEQMIGYLKSSNIYIVLARSVPDDYMVVHARGSGPVLGMREYPAAGLQGLFVETDNDGGVTETRLLRYCGFGAMNRVGAVVQYIGSDTYAIPSGFSAPLAV